MKKVLFASLCCAGAWLLPQAAQAAPSPSKKISSSGGNFGVGLSLGDPMGLSGKWFMAPNHALQFDLGWAPLHHGDGRLGADYLWHPGTLASGKVADLVPYVGLGVGVMFWGGRGCGYYYDDDRDGRRRGHCGRDRGGGAAMFIRAPILGFAVHWKGAPVDTVFEGSWSPYLVYPDLSHGDFSFKIRYYF